MTDDATPIECYVSPFLFLLQITELPMYSGLVCVREENTVLVIMQQIKNQKLGSLVDRALAPPYSQALPLWVT